MSEPEFIITGDGSHSLMNTALNETYHSRHGAVQESNHVFIHHGLDDFLAQRQTDTLSILEIGFGTGLNAFLTLKKVFIANEGRALPSVHYTAIEGFPLPESIWRALNYIEKEAPPLPSLFYKLHEAAWNEPVEISPDFILRKEHIMLETVELPSDQYDLVYFDAFAPSRQPELWTFSVLQRVVASTKTGGMFVTYCARGQLKRDLRALNMEVETLPGPPGKKEMTRAIKR